MEGTFGKIVWLPGTKSLWAGLRLRALELGAHMAVLFMGAVCYADDVLLISPTRNAMQRMLLKLKDLQKNQT